MKAAAGEIVLAHVSLQPQFVVTTTTCGAMMPCEFSLDPTTRLVHSRAWGMLTEQDLLGHVQSMEELFAAGGLDATWSQLADFTLVESFEELTTAGVRRIASRNPWPVDAKRVLLSPSPVGFGLCRMYQLMTGDESAVLSVVRTEHEAMTLLVGES